MTTGVWYEDYNRLKDEVFTLKDRFEKRCNELGVPPWEVQAEVRREIIARIVHESNWQEDLYLDPVRTRELADVVFDNPIELHGPHLDMKRIADIHRKEVLQLLREGYKPEEIAAFSLSRAHVALQWIEYELIARKSAALAAALADISRIPNTPAIADVTDVTARASYEVREATNDTTPLDLVMTHDISTVGELLQQLMSQESDSLRSPMRVDHIHFLHRLTTVGLIPARKCGHFRKIAVHIPTNRDLYFPSPSLVPGLMDEFSKDYSRVIPISIKRDPILTSAELSHQFVAIHPYADGNGRVSRLLMNLLLWRHFLPVYLKADKKGRHRYVQALKRADRGNYKPLASLIAMSLVEIYERLLRTVTR